MRRVMVLVGGHSNEREISLKTGQSVANALLELGDEVKVLDTGRPEQPALAPGEFEAGLLSDEAQAAGLPAIADVDPGAREKERRHLARTLGERWQPELVFVALHGGMGEDGTVQALLDWLGLPYTGCDMAASALAMNKMNTKRLLRDAGLEVPEGYLRHLPEDRIGDPSLVDEIAKQIEAALGYPAIAKPNREGSSVGLAVLHSREDASLKLPRVIRTTRELLVETFIPGREVTAAILGGEVLPLVEIEPESGLYDYAHKYSQGKTRYHCPADLAQDVTDRIVEEARLAWDLLGCRHIARVDFRVTNDGTPFCLELNSIPGMTETSLVPMAAAAKGLDFPSLVAEIARLALKNGS
jgi:D-alanine-D-alanine ligase